jgi:hypothetical protein
MPELAPILRELGRLEAIQHAFAELSHRTDDRRKHDMIDLRRRLSVQIAEIGKVCEPLFAAHGGPDILQQFRNIFSRMRSAAAIHQANWPAVRLGESDAEFERSAATVREANREFLEWTRSTIIALRARG